MKWLLWGVGGLVVVGGGFFIYRALKGTAGIKAASIVPVIPLDKAAPAANLDVIAQSKYI